MTPIEVFYPSLAPSFESIRKRAKKLARQIGAGEPDALARVHAQLLNPTPPHRWARGGNRCAPPSLCSLREYGCRRTGRTFAPQPSASKARGLEWAVAEAEAAPSMTTTSRAD